MKTTIETVIWDLGNVLINWDPRNLYHKIIRSEKSREWFLANVCTPDWNEQQDAGRTWEEGNRILIKKFPQYEALIRAFSERWEETLGGPIVGSETILRQLKKNNTHRLYALTNWSAETFPVALERYDFLQLFEGILVSGEEKLKKPDPKIYELIFDRYQINPATALFIDDSAKNIAGAAAVGLHTIHFTTAEQLLVELKTFNVL